MSKTLIVALLFFVGAGCRTSMTAPADPTWSAPSDGLRARLVARQGRVRAGASLQIDIELENVGAAPLRVVLDDPFAFTARLDDAGGRELSPTGSRLDILSAPREEMIAPGQTIRSPLAMPHSDAQAELDVTTSMWKLAPGQYQLSGRFTGTGPAGTWTSTLELPPISIEIL